MNDMLEAGMANHGGNAVLRVYIPDGPVRTFTELDPYQFIDRAPLVYHAFQYGHHSKRQAELEAPSERAATILVDYVRTGLYPQDHLEDLEPILFLPHIHTYLLARNLDVRELQTHAYGALKVTTFRAISLGAPPTDLIDAIRFVYQHISNPQDHDLHNIVSALTEYCFEAFTTQGLDHNEAFIQLLRDLPFFARDLCKVCSDREFKAWAQTIIALAHGAPPVRSEPNPTTLASRDLPDEMYIDEEEATWLKQEEMEEIADMTSADETLSLADSIATIRQVVKAEDSDSDMEDEEKTAVAFVDSQDDEKTAVGYASESEDGFYMVRHPTAKPMPTSKIELPHRPKPNEPMLNEPLSSPEMIAMPEGHISDDEDYSML